MIKIASVIETLLTISLLINLVSSYYLKKDDAVIILTDDNFDFVIRDYDYVLV
jgi:hypothetical protein